MGGGGGVGQGVHGQGKSQGKKYFFKVRELSGNFEICQGILEFMQKSGKVREFRRNQSINDKNIKNKAKAVSSCLAIIIIIIIIIIKIIIIIIQWTHFTKATFVPKNCVISLNLLS